MAKNTNNTKKSDKFWSDNRSLNWKTLNYFNQVEYSYFSTYWQNWAQTNKLKPNQTLFYRTYSNLRSFFSFDENIKVFQWISKSKFLNFLFEAYLNNENKTKSDKFLHRTCSNLTSFFISPKTLNYFNDFYI